jgi:hypothetical protein
MISAGMRRGGSFTGTLKDCGSVLEKSAGTCDLLDGRG